MADLSPAAQAVLDATVGDGCVSWRDRRRIAAAALCAAAGQVVPEDGDPIYGLTPTGAYRQVVRRKILALATELETR